ncbi:MAG TPA: glycoside hydrolase family 15 protein [Gemmatimonadaceae bacterium]|nr:glycoside hydrolase family 15 protein [Gemmatimonadaceae bacterium]
MSEADRLAPGWPGLEPRWTTSAKSAVGTALGDGSRVWFTASHGILNELYYPEVDTACLRDAGFMITARDGFFSEEKRDCDHGVEWLAPGVPAFRLRNRCRQGRYEIEKRVCTSTDYDVVLQHVRFTPLHGALGDYTITLLLSPHLGNHGAGNTGWVGASKGERILFAQRDGLALAVACSPGFGRCTAGFAGSLDAWHDVRANGRLVDCFDRAENGNIALAAEIEMLGAVGEFTIAIGFGRDAETAALHARASLLRSYDESERAYAAPWRAWQGQLLALDEAPPAPAGAAPGGGTDSGAAPRPLYRASTAVMRTHMSVAMNGGAIASLSVPWGSSKGDGDLGGYHLVWPRDMVEMAGGLLAAGAHREMRDMLGFLAVSQEPDGHWPQNMWLNGTPYWHGVQLDEAAFPILLVDGARRADAIWARDVARFWGMVRRAACFVAMHGPATDQDRWEEDAGYSPFTLAVTIAALLAAAELADAAGEPLLAAYLRDTADDWNADIERWSYVEDTPLSRSLGVQGYYIRIGNARADEEGSPTRGATPVKNRAAGHAEIATYAMVSADALALVRFGLRDAHDRRVTDTVRVIDALLREETATGPAWKRYNEDGYGEHEDGSPFDGTGVGRGWPLLAGERAHYELAAGRVDEAARLAAVMRAQTSPGGMLPEQVWDAPDVAPLELRNGHPTGSAMPLVWAHAEYVKLLRSLREGRVHDCPPQARARYVERANVPRVTGWRVTRRVSRLRAGSALRIDAPEPVRVRWTADAWATCADAESQVIAPSVHVAELPTQRLAAGAVVEFALYWPGGDRWEGRNFSVTVEGAAPTP